MSSAALARAAQAALARRSLLDFCRGIYPGFQAPPHIRHIAGLLEAVERGEILRLAISVQPGSGKSTLLQLFGAWHLGRDGRRKIIATSAGAELAERNSRATRSLFTEDAWPFDVQLDALTSAQHRWNTQSGGGMVAVGVDAIITGWRGDLLLCDDLQNSAGTENERAALWQWYREVLTPRLEPRGAIVIIQTRWSEDDLIGRIIESDEGAEWTVVNLPAIADEHDALGRAPGEALWPERFDLVELEKRRTAMGSRAFSCQFLGAPVPASGNLIKADWLGRYRSEDLPQTFDVVAMGLDCAAKTGIANDYSAIATVGASKNALFVLDMQRRKVEYPELRRMLEDAYRPVAGAATVYVEDASSGTALLQDLRAETRLPVVGVRPIGSKVSRVEGISGLFESGRVRLPVDAPWLVEFERELLAFPNAKHDDMVDALTLALSQIRERTRQKPFAMRGAAVGGW